VLFPSGHRYSGRVALSLVLGICTIGASIGLLATSGYLISKAALRPEILTLTVAIVGVRFFGIVRAICRYLERLASHDVTFRLLADLRVRLYERLAHSGLASLRSGDLLSRFVSDVDSLQHVFVRVLAPPLIALGAIAIAVGLAAALLPGAGVVLLLALLVAATLVPLLGRFAVRASGRRKSPAQAELTSELVELLSSSSTARRVGSASAFSQPIAG
jgi:ABC-type transport system involved in cytochrome bd biosynthesis fused ATPase/permease subunit